MNQQIGNTELREKSQHLLQGAFKHVRAAALAAALVPLGAVAVSPAAAQFNGSGGTSCTVETAIVSNFNGTRIAAGNVIWFNSVFSVKGLGADPVTIYFTNSMIQFDVGGTPYDIAVPSAYITFIPGGTTATTSYEGLWVTTVPSSGLAGNTFLDGVAFEVPPGGFPGGIKPVAWSGTFISDTPGVTIGWKWGAAVYTNFADEYSLDVKPVDDNKASSYQNSDHAGTPENFKTFVIGGTRGGGGSNYTGSYSGTQSTECQ